MKKAWGSEEAVFENVMPNGMVDTNGTFFCSIPDPYTLCGYSLQFVKITPEGQITTEWWNMFTRLSVSGYDFLQISDRSPVFYKVHMLEFLHKEWSLLDQFSTAMLPVISTCIAHEESASDYFYAIGTPASTMYWDTEGDNKNRDFLFIMRIQKSDLNLLVYDDWAHINHPNVAHESYFDEYTHKAFCRNVHTASFDPKTDRLNIFWLHETGDGWTKTNLFMNKLSINVKPNPVWRDYTNTCYSSKEAFWHINVGLEARITQTGSEDWFSVTYGGVPYAYKTPISGPKTETDMSVSTKNCFGYLESENTQIGSCYYHSDQQIIQHNGKNLTLNLGMVRLSKMSQLSCVSASSRASWANKNFVPNPEYLALVLVSSYGNENFEVTPSNILVIFPVKNATTEATAFLSTLYKNTFKFVTCSKNGQNYIIYAYCYPGKTKQLYLGVCRYDFDTTGHLYLFSKREFRNTKDESFDKLKDCSRICFMDVRAGHLWVLFARSDSKQFYYFYAKADDIVQYAP